jgi:hypothetical protein
MPSGTASTAQVSAADRVSGKIFGAGPSENESA